MKPCIAIFGLLPLAACGGIAAPAVPPEAPSSPTLSIAELQGRGAVSPYAGQGIVTTGIVTGDFQDDDADVQNDLGGFFIQDLVPDGDPLTSDGMFVFDGYSAPVAVTVGHVVEVRGTVSEFFGETQLQASAVRITGQGKVTPTDVELPAPGVVVNDNGKLIADLERYEGMLIRFPQPLSVTDLRHLQQFGAVTLAQGGRVFQFTNNRAPDVAGFAQHGRDIARRTVVLDDGLRSMNPVPLRLLAAGAGPSIRAGDSVTGLTGNLRYARGSGSSGDAAWRLMPTVPPAFESRNPRPGAPEVGGALRVASFNVLNFFSTVDDGQRRCGPAASQDCRGADSAEELDRQRRKTAAALAMLDADIVGLMELENNARASLQMIVDDLNARIGKPEFEFIHTGAIGDDAIKTGFVYRQTTVTPVGRFALLDRSVDARFDDARNRPALAQTFRATANGATLTVVVNHLKSKGSSCATAGDPNLGDGQGECNLTRTRAAAAIADWLATDPTGSGDPDFLVIGDMNAYAREDPMTAFQSGGLVDLLDAGEQPYSFLFDGQAGALDHALASPSLVPQVVGALEWHINADEPPVLDYNLEFGRDPTLFDGDSPYRAADHDPVVIGIDPAN